LAGRHHRARPRGDEGRRTDRSGAWPPGAVPGDAGGVSGAKPQLGLIGFGAFGRLTAKHLAPWFDIVAHDPAASDGDGLARLTTLEEAAACPVVVLAVPVGVLAETVAAIAPSVTPGALILDVGSVKVKPAK